MTTAYAKEFMDEYEVIDKSYFDTRNPFALNQRNSYARELRKAGWKVVSQHMCINGEAHVYTIHATRPRLGIIETAYAAGN